jgi:5-methylcytosine-specific restriction endonuclease McrBC regulatory subunit McrC
VRFLFERSTLHMLSQCEGGNHSMAESAEAKTGLLGLPLVIVRIVIEEVCVLVRKGGVVAE